MNQLSNQKLQGVFYLIVINENKPQEIIQEMNVLGFDASVILYRVCGWEGLSLLRFTRKQL